ncbi:hypothetical protein N0V90_009312 [Kalmusia sp. IMI 367209]|nr:hypothetical protein N0V90_009312 [Kalmusia sp. IMI 367209]
MSADSINIITIDFPDPYLTEHEDDHFDPLSVRSSENLLRIVPNHELIDYELQLNESFQYPITNNIQTLSSKGVERGDDPYGILYVPDLQTDDCRNTEKQYVAKNATRLSDLPLDAGYALIAVAPWYSPKCMLEYFATARAEPVKAFIVYKPGNSTDLPPETNNVAWALGDGGGWQFANQFPTYAIPPASGAVVAHQLSLYSGNVSTAPYGDALKDKYDSTDYIRLWAKVTADSGTQLPSLWVFLVIVLGLLILIIGATSLCMHVVQRRRRNALRQRVINGEVDLEALGVKRLTVPEDYLMKLPVYAYLGEPEDSEKDINQPSTGATNLLHPATTEKSNPLSRRSSAPDMPAATRASAIFSQSTCPICLDDFEHNESQVRELPCRHIFHVDCIDPFLLNNSSLCPICKQSVLPPGYCPARITNVMVRRERIISSRRAHNESGQIPGPGNLIARLPGAYDSLRARVGGASGGRRIFSAPTQQPRPSEIEMTSTATTIPVAESAANGTVSQEIITAPEPTHGNTPEGCPEPPAHHTQQRREWARQRALTLLGNRNMPADAEEEEQPRSRWKRGLHKIFPGFR